LPDPRLIPDIRALIARVGDTSALILNPVIDSYYLAYMSVATLPERQDLLSQLRSLSVTVAAAKGATQGELVRLNALTGLLRSNVDSTQKAFAVAFAN